MEQKCQEQLLQGKYPVKVKDYMTHDFFSTPLENNRTLLAHHDPTRHPAAPKDAEYPLKAGTPTKATAASSKPSSSAVTTSGPHGASRQFLDFADLPNRYRHPLLTEAEIEAVEAGGATAIY
ncbi:hypothetical protein BG015_008439 [Linnemannia schmuckeri]|uniref:Uncharacterized protein n=1 Tax=Linnemannia schmuckeri TaxID=64567 RepID=A0A9P5RXG7_9FUNG|nr:hypothetical protein BG015_008439 [Linnemannia schmuckeri]